MLQKIIRLMTPETKKKLVSGLPFRIYSRLQMKNKYIRISTEITTKCNCNCAMCTRLDRVKQGRLKVMDMEPKTINKILEQIKLFVDHDYPVIFAPMGLGEPLMYKNLYKLISDIKKISKKVRIVIVTNGVLLSPETSKKLVDLGVDEISISLNVNNDADYKKYVGGKNYSLVVDNIKKLISYRNKKNASGTGILVQYLAYTSDIKKFDNDIKRWQKIMRYGDKCYVHPIVNEGGFNETKLVNFKNNNVFPCCSPIQTMAVRVNGDLYTCDASFFNGNSKIDELYLGNINKINYFKDIHSNKNSKIYKILESMKNNDYCKLKNCQKCHNYKLAPNPFFKIFGKWR